MAEGPGDALRGRGPHQLEPRVAEQRRAGIADQHDMQALRDARQHFRQSLGFIVSVQGEQGTGNAQVLEQALCAACVLGRDEIRALKSLADPVAEIPHIADGRGDDGQPAWCIPHIISSVAPSCGRSQGSATCPISVVPRTWASPP
jgi:hypothetical protein